VRDLVTGSGLEFVDAGAHQLKGVPGEWHLFALAGEPPVPAPLPVPGPAPSSAWTARRPSLRLLAAAGGGLAVAIAAFLVLGLAHPASAAQRVNTVVAFDPQAGSIERAVAVGAGPSLMVTDGSRLWVASDTARTLTRIDLQSGEASQVGLDGVPTGLALGDNAVNVTLAFDHSIQRYDIGTGAAMAPIDGLTVRALAFADDQGWGIDPVAEGVVHLSQAREIGRVALPAGGGASDVTIGFGAVWVTDALGRSVSRLDPATGEVASVSLGIAPTRVIAHAGSIWAVGETSDALARVDPTTRRQLGSTKVCDGPVDLAEAGQDLYVVCSGSRQLVRVSSDGDVLQAFDLPYAPSALAVVDGIVWVALRAD
jgi:streptogramin lyase